MKIRTGGAGQDCLELRPSLDLPGIEAQSGPELRRS